MFCPKCLFPNLEGADLCVVCQADVIGGRERISVGAQFVFAEASQRRPLALSLDGAPPQLLTEPTIISRHVNGIGFGNAWIQPDKFRKEEYKPEVELPRLPPPAGPDLTAVITDRKIYRPKDEARIFILAPDAPGAEVEMEVQLAGQQISKDRVTLDEAGLALRPYADLEEGEYTVLIRRPVSGGDAASSLGADLRKAVKCTFSVAEFSLSPLTARLESHSYDAGHLKFRLRVMALSVPYDGKAELGLQSGELVVETKQASVRDGLVEASFDVKKHEGPFRVQITTPGGETASVFFPGTAKTERERITLCPLGRVAEAGLLPSDGTHQVRGLHVGYGGEENTPLRLESAVGDTGRLIADRKAAAVQVVTFHPFTGATSVYAWTDVSPDDVLDFPVEAPYTLFTVGLLASRQSYEAWGVVIRPQEVSARLSAPERAEPGAEIAIRVEADRPCACLLAVYDVRLEHESPLPKLGKQMYDAIRTGTERFREHTVPSLSNMPWGWGNPFGPDAVLYRAGMPPRSGPVFATAPKGVLFSMSSAIAETGRPTLERAFQEVGAAPETAVEVETVTFVAAPSREDFPEVAYLELLAVDGTAERTLRLGDQIGTWRCRAYVVAGLDVVELTADVDAAKAVYAELDLPAIVGQGDDILAGVHYHTQNPATMTIALPGGQTISGGVMGHGVELFHLTEPGTVTVHIASAEGDDWTTRTVDPPGLQMVTASRLEILKKGEMVQAERVVVYAGPGDVLKETIEALGRYPFG
jgi:hypothetical protein